MGFFSKKTFGTGLGIVALVSAVTATAHAGKDHTGAVGARHGQMEMIAFHTGVLGGMAKGEIEYDAATAAAAASNLNALAKLHIPTLWPLGTAQGEVNGSRAKPTVWSDPAGFEAKFKMFEDASAAMMTAAATDLDALRGGMKAIGGSCKACHQDYRGPKTD